MKETANNRRHPRAPLLSIVQCELSGGRTLTAASGNVSRGGLFISTNQAVPAGQSARVRFRLPYPGHNVEQTARVVWSRATDASPEAPAGIGLEFQDLPLPDRSAIDQYVRHAAQIVA